MLQNAAFGLGLLCLPMSQCRFYNPLYTALWHHSDKNSMSINNRYLDFVQMHCLISLVNDNHIANNLKGILVHVYFGSIVNNPPQNQSNVNTFLAEKRIFTEALCTDVVFSSDELRRLCADSVDALANLDVSNEYPQHMFCGEIRKYISVIPYLKLVFFFFFLLP